MRGRSAAFAAALLVAACAGLSLFASAAGASVKCVKRDGVLRVFPYADPRIDLDFAGATVVRQGRRIDVRDVGRVDCRGRQATVHNTRRIVFRQVGLSFSDIDLGGGPFRHPGTGAAIEVTLVARPGALGYGIIDGTAGPDRWRMAPVRRGIGLWLGFRSGPPDVRFRGPGAQGPFLSLGDGADRFDASAVPRVRDRRFITVVSGGGGPDRLFGSFGEDLLSGGPGSDRLLGFGHRDRLQGGPGRDLIGGGGGADSIGAHDAARDVAVCGPGRDRARLDRGDIVRACETRRYGEYREPAQVPPPPWASRLRLPG